MIASDGMGVNVPRRVLVLGGGTMGRGIALAFAEAGCDVSLWSRDPSRAEAALRWTQEQALFLQREGLGPDPAPVVERITRVATVEDAATPAEVVVEAITEHLDAKRELFARLDETCPAEVLLASTTSGLRVSDIAAGLDHAERVVAMHFWNPAHLMPIVEISGGSRTSARTVARAREVAASIGKLPIVLDHEVLGFLGTRMQQAVLREAIALLDAGVASAQDLDLAVRVSFGIRFPVVGPIESADLTGLDVIEAIHRYLLPDLDASVSPQAGLRSRVERGELGVKSGRGFYDWGRRDAGALIRARDEELVRRLRLLAQEGLIRLPPSEAPGSS
jgi:3-hydroxybutyryl-CoA dehydrogenase